MIRSADAVGELGTILGIWAHPDDEAYLSGGLMALATDAGSRVVCVTATHGELGTPDPVAWPPDRLAAERTVEMARCLAILGVTEHHWLGYADGGCAAVPEAAAVARLCEVLVEVRPDTVLTFGPDGITGHLDHRTVWAWAAAAFDRAAPPGARLLQAAITERRGLRWAALHEKFDVFEAGYPVTTPEAGLAVDLTLDGGTVERKVRALAAQATQTAGLIEAMGLGVYTEWVAEETYVQASG
jgi:LmbE family N-acetylglucosaminyl deacetylase